MTALPRNVASSELPVGNSATSGVERVGNCLRATKRGNEFLSHAALSHTVTAIASPKSHNVCVALSIVDAQSVTMESQDKNGGPNHLRDWRTFRGLSQAALAERVGTNANMIQYLETGERGLSAKWLRKLAPALETTPGLLLDHDPHDLDGDILEIWGNANAREKRQISEVAKALLATGTAG